MRVFVSYAHEHREIADALALRLREAGHDLFFDREDLPPAESFDDRIRQALARSDLLVFLVSPESVATLVGTGFTAIGEVVSGDPSVELR